VFLSCLSDRWRRCKKAEAESLGIQGSDVLGWEREINIGGRYSCRYLQTKTCTFIVRKDALFFKEKLQSKEELH